MMRFSSKKVLCHIIVWLNVTSFLPIISLHCRKLDSNNISSFIYCNIFSVILRPPRRSDISLILRKYNLQNNC